MSGAIGNTGEDLLALLDLPGAGQGVFTGPPAADDFGRSRVFGGQVLAQGLAAACFTVPPELPCHSLHAYFVRPGMAGRPIDYEVTVLRDGQNFSSRNVAAVQRDELIGQLIASFGADQAGYEYQQDMPATPPPESFPAEPERLARMLAQADAQQRAVLQHTGPAELIHVDLADLRDRTPAATPWRTWLRLRAPLPPDPNLQRCALAYVSDMGMIGPSLRAVGASHTDPELQIASLDHALWFHRPFTWGDWLLFVTQPISVAAGRGLSRGSIYARSGQLLASVVQEGLMRKRDPLPEGA